MRPLRTFTIEPALPPKLKQLSEIAENLWWSWHGDAQDIFRRLDREAWEECYHNPVAMLGQLGQDRLEKLARDDGFISHIQRVHEDLQRYLTDSGWWPKTYGTDHAGPTVAYFCAEYGITETLPIYSGGLGVLAGDHMKSASELNVPLVGIGLLYQQGYFRQRLNADGWQLELFPRNDFANLPCQRIRTDDGAELSIDIDLADHVVKAYVWRVRMGRTDLYLLDTNVPSNSPEDRHITAQLYGGDQETRIRQEIILGVGGVRMLRALGFSPKVYHMNEGHSAFLSLERIRFLMSDWDIDFHTAAEIVVSSNVFTTHTPVPAGNDAFEPWLIEKYMGGFAEQLGISTDDFLGLGRQETGNNDEPMCLTILAMRMAKYRNGVSELHGRISRSLWADVWPGVPDDEIPIRHITNGIHTPSWISHELSALYDRYLGPDWSEKWTDTSTWEAAENIPDPELWRTHERRRERLVSFARRRLRKQLSKRGAGAAELATAQEVLDPEALTIGFARRFATYKRAGIILSDIPRLKKLLNNPDKPVQIIFSGKAHPRDNPGKDLIRQIVHISRQEPFRRSLLFLEDYDINVARYLVQGVDVWLNTPLRPMEASGTSGMKVSANGGLNLSIPDGWWAEAYRPDLGWAIGSGESYDDLEYQNRVESQALYDLLEKDIVPLFYRRGKDKLPREWIAMMKASIRELAPRFSSNRMVHDYSVNFYAPAARQWDRLTADDLALAKTLSAWKHELHENFGNIRIESVSDDMDADGHGAQVGKTIRVEATVDLGQLSPNDVLVELYFGSLDEDGQLITGRAAEMTRVSDDSRPARYVVDMPCPSSGRAGYTVRILPKHEAMGHPLEMSMIRWA
ncbi:MAG: alpha-glucan family phosphorylase [Phycisphaerae bacterium]|jgi:starch phosphorylase|nr:alpha-glucan family phosphorylase [Phycisphaerae bacterium]